MKVPAHLDQTIVTANGKVLHIGKPYDGLIVVDETTEKPVISFDEVSGDEDVVHVFVKFAPGAAFGRMNEDGSDEEHAIVGDEGVNNTHEILIRRDEHKLIDRVKE